MATEKSMFHRARAIVALLLFVTMLGCNGFFVDPTLTALSVGPAATINEGTTLQMAASGTYSNGNTKTLTDQVEWTTSAENVATVSSSGLVTGVSSGPVTITASYQSMTATADITVDIGDVTTLAISPDSATVAAGKTATFHASATVAGGAAQDVTATATWSTNNPDVTIESQGASPVVVQVGSSVTSGTTVTITASYVSSSTVTATATLVVQ